MCIYVTSIIYHEDVDLFSFKRSPIDSVERDLANGNQLLFVIHCCVNVSALYSWVNLFTQNQFSSRNFGHISFKKVQNKLCI